jgi:hypothetical protein
MIRAILVGVVGLLFAAPAALTGQEPARTTPNTLQAAAEGAGPRATLADAAWLIGSWTGPGLGGVSEETWAPAAGGAMMGMFRLVINRRVSFYEFMNLAEENGTLVLKLKHFNPDMTGWEEKDRWVTFRLARVSPGVLEFGGLTFRRNGDTGLRIFLALRDANGVREETFELERR